jgi:serine/threonine protein kinase
VPDPTERTSSPPLLAGRYVLGEAFAAGGMGTVHLGRLVGAGGFSRVVAIKRLSPGFAGDPSFRQGLLDEARLASRIRHPNVVAILDVVEAGRDLYVVMEYVHGVSLADVLVRTKGAPIPIEVAVGVAEGVLRGLHAAHEARGEDGTPLGIVHRDVSPQNILIGADGVARLIDFGIAKAATIATVTDAGVLKGKASYMSPEQILKEPVSRQADVFSSSVVLWEMLANRPLFTVFDVVDRIRQIGKEILPPGRSREGLDPALDAIVLRGLATRPAQRFATAEAMASALREGRPPCAPAEIARWLTRFAGDELELSEERVRLLEQLPPVAPIGAADASGGSPVVASLPASSTSTSRESVPSTHERRAKAWLPVLAASIALVAALVAFRAVGRASGGGAALRTSVGAAVSEARDPPPAALDVPAPPATEPPPPAPVSAPRPLAPPSAGSPKAASARPRRGLKGKCDPPYTVDANGFKHYDPACF